ncbi:MAG: hypothetical protein O3B68_20845, partial [Planctomycetota bacterium]|nr:hypothetical protein [Planctomycetota bacterium]
MTATGCQVSHRHSRTVLSLLPPFDASNPASGEIAAHRNQLVCPSNTFVVSPVSASQMRTVLPSLAEASRCTPSALAQDWWTPEIRFRRRVWFGVV